MSRQIDLAKAVGFENDTESVSASDDDQNVNDISDHDEPSSVRRSTRATSAASRGHPRTSVQSPPAAKRIKKEPAVKKEPGAQAPKGKVGRPRNKSPEDDDLVEGDKKLTKQQRVSVQ